MGRLQPEIFEFLTELAANNDRAWWEENKDRYVELIREPALDFIEDFRPRLARLSPHFTADARISGGSLMRPYRDVRFSRDKTPFKVNVGIQFRHEAGKDVHAPGYYLHLEPGRCFAGAGMWHPEPAVAARLREAINDRPDGWRLAAKRRAFTGWWSIEPDPEDILKRLPKGLDPDHPFADDLKMRSFIAGATLVEADVTSPDFGRDLASRYARASGFMAFLCSALDLPF